MGDEMSEGEIRRSIARIENAQRDAHKAIDDRLAALAQQTVPAALFASEHKALGEDVRHLEGDMHDAIALIERTSRERMATLRGEIAGVRGEVAAVRKAQENHVKAHEASGAWSRSKKLGIAVALIGATATLVAVYIAAVLAAKGVR